MTGAMSRCTSTVSSALQMVGRRTFALYTMSTAIAGSAARSTYVWHTPAPVSMTGIVAFSMVALIKPSPPRGMMTSMYSRSFSIRCTSARSVDVIICTDVSGSPASFKPA